MEKKINDNNKILKGKVVSDKMKDTVVVLVERYVKHPKYKNILRKVRNLRHMILVINVKLAIVL